VKDLLKINSNFMVEKKEHEDKEKVAVVYELGYHLVPSLGEDDLALRVTELQKAIIAEGGSVISEGQPQAFTLAYPMRKMRGGRWDHYESSFFGWVRFEVPAEGVLVLKEMLDTNEYLIRYLLVKLDPVALIPEPVREPRHESTEVEVEPKMLVKKQDEEEVKGEVSEEELDKQIEQLIH
jgi:ribosomal protein S6